MKTYITAIGTANPLHSLPQAEIGEFMADALNLQGNERRRLKVLYRASGIQSRQSVIEDYGKKNGDFTFFPNTRELEPFPDVADRMALYKDSALDLCVKAAHRCFEGTNGIANKDITHIISVSCTGMYAPGLDIELVEALSLSTHVQRTAINFMGCYAAFNALKVADAICRADADANVLLVCVELCSIHFQKKNDDDNLLANALFGDGAAAVILTSKPKKGLSLSLENFYCDLAYAGKQEMAWNIGGLGFEMRLSAYVPDIIKLGIKKLADNLLQKISLSRKNIDLFAIHPGGKKILETIEKELGLTRQDNACAYKVLREHGNMSSPTVLFVLKEIMDGIGIDEEKKNILSFAFGPGLTMESMLLKSHYN